MVDDDAYDELFSAPVEEFVAKRDALVKQLKADGDKEQAAVVKSWRRPARVIGALNRLALRDPDTAAEFVDAARALESASGAAMREANEAFRAAVREAAAVAADALDDTRTSDLGEVTSALLTVGADEEALASFQDGRLLDVPDAGQGGFGFGFGLGDGGGGGGAAAAPARKKPAKASTGTKKAAAREDELAVRRAAAERKRLEQAVERAQEDVEQAEARASEVREQAGDAEAQVADAQRALEEAQAALTSANEAVEGADAELEEAQAALEEAEAALAGHAG